MSVTPSHILEYLFCPRFTYFEYVLGIPQNEDKYYKVTRGREVHEEKTNTNREYLRKRIGAIDKLQNQYLTNDILRGEVDEVLFLEDATMAPLDFKFAKFEDRIYDTYKTQLHCYAVLIEENFQKPVNKGFLVYTRSKNYLAKIDISQADKDQVKETANNVMEVIQNNHFPKATKYKKRCHDCTYRNICIK